MTGCYSEDQTSTNNTQSWQAVPVPTVMPRCWGSQHGTRQINCHRGIADKSGTCHNRPQPISCISCTDCFRPSGSGQSPVWHAPHSTLWLSRPAEIAPMIHLLSSSTFVATHVAHLRSPYFDKIYKRKMAINLTHDWSVSPCPCQPDGLNAESPAS